MCAFEEVEASRSCKDSAVAMRSTMTPTLLLVCCLVYLFNKGNAFSGELPENLEQAIYSYMDHYVKANDLQRMLDSAPVEYSELSADTLVHEISQSLSEKFVKTANAVTRLQEAIEREYEKDIWQDDVTECCKLEKGLWDPEYDNRFKTEVDLYRSCSRISADSKGISPRKHSTSLIAFAMESLHDTSGMKYQYYGDEDGIFTQYPAVSTGSNCDSYDNRFRPWYVIAASPIPKDLVVVIDTSGSMLIDNRIEGAKSAVLTVLETLNPNDRIALVTFSNFPTTPASCYSEKMALATPTNIKFLTKWVNKITPSGSTQFLHALHKAFDYLSRANKQPVADPLQRRNPVMLFMSDGEPSDDLQGIFSAIKNRNQDMGDKVVIMTYAFGEDARVDILENMANQDGSDYGVPRSDTAPRGLFTAVTGDSSNLRSKMGSYYDYFKSEYITKAVHWSIPYYDAIGGSGLVMTASAAVVVDGRLRGVVGADITMKDLVVDIIHYKRDSETAYSFMVDNYFRAMAHPFLPAPSSVTDDPVFINISVFESQELTDRLLGGILSESFSNGVNGTVSARMEGFWITEQNHGFVKKHQVQVEAACMQVEGTLFASCVVLRAEEKHRRRLPYQANEPQLPFNYHRIDLSPPHTKRCMHMDRTSFMGSAIKLAPKAFVDTDRYLAIEETAENVSAYINAIAGEEHRHQGLEILGDAMNDVRFTALYDDIWRRASQDSTGPEILRTLALWRYIGTSNGVFRIWPGVAMAKEYDPTQRPWYKSAVVHKNRNSMVITVPYKDASTDRWVITFAKAVFYRDLLLTPYAVIGSDVFLSDFLKILHTYEEECEVVKCVIIDNYGYLIYHESFAESLGAQDVLMNRHIVNVEPMIASVLINEGLMDKESCLNASTIKIEFGYRVEVGTETWESPGGDFEAARIGDTNGILIKITKEQPNHTPCHRHEDFKESCMIGQQCEAPCESDADFDACLNVLYPPLPPPCSASKPPLDVLPPDDEITAKLPDCYTYLEEWEDKSQDGLYEERAEEYPDNSEIFSEDIMAEADPTAIITTTADTGDPLVSVLVTLAVALTVGLSGVGYCICKSKRPTARVAAEPNTAAQQNIAAFQAGLQQGQMSQHVHAQGPTAYGPGTHVHSMPEYVPAQYGAIPPPPSYTPPPPKVARGKIAPAPNAKDLYS